jgi:hypothetical protein
MATSETAETSRPPMIHTWCGPRFSGGTRRNKRHATAAITSIPKPLLAALSARPCGWALSTLIPTSRASAAATRHSATTGSLPIRSIRSVIMRFCLPDKVFQTGLR